MYVMASTRFYTFGFLISIIIAFLAVHFDPATSACSRQDVKDVGIRGWLANVWGRPPPPPSLDWFHRIQTWQCYVVTVSGKIETGIFHSTLVYLGIVKEPESFLTRLCSRIHQLTVQVLAFANLTDKKTRQMSTPSPSLAARVREYVMTTATCIAGTTARYLDFPPAMIILGIASCLSLMVLALASLNWIRKSREKNVCDTLLHAIASKYQTLKLLRTDNDFQRLQMVSRISGQQIFMKCQHIACSREARNGLNREYKVLKELSQLNIVTILDWTRVGPRRALGLEYATYGDLKSAMGIAPTQFGCVDRLSVFRQVTEAVQYLHRSYLAHLNIRPGTVLVFDKWNRVKLSGFSRVFDTNGGWDLYCSRYNYQHQECSPPEVKRRMPYNAFAADVWSLGSLFYFILTGSCLDPESQVPGEGALSSSNLDITFPENGILQKLLSELLYKYPSRRPVLSRVLGIVNSYTRILLWLTDLPSSDAHSN